MDGLIDTTPYVTDTLFLFCGRRHNKIKGLVWEEDGYLMLYKRLSDGYFQWPKCREDVLKLTKKQFKDLMSGLSVEQKVTIRKVKPEYVA
ncbi:MAG: IS66 family insertion sequence element accessory protein TnpB [Lachnospiraceae bacterium]|nr:IS66 family insertion sequence element accessory protein TnpB [Lachnospiraceae bacterium]